MNRQEVIENAKKNQRLAIGCAIGVLVIVGIVLWNMFGGAIPDRGSGADRATAELSAAKAELDSARRELSESRELVTKLEQSNRDAKQQVAESRAALEGLRQAHSDLAREVSEGRAINSNSGDIIDRCQQILARVQERGPARN